MNLLLVTFIVMLLFVVTMAVGVICGRSPLKGSCGGLNKIGIDGKCEICGREPDERCDNGSSDTIEDGQIAFMTYDATQSRTPNQTPSKPNPS